MNTSLYDFGQGFKPPQNFFLEPYVLGYSVSLMGLFRNFMFKGQKWATRKTGEYMIAAFAELQRDTTPLDMDTLNKAMVGFQGNPIFTEGMSDAELNFGAMFGMIKNTNSEPVVVEARAMAQGLQAMASDISQGDHDPDAGFKIAIARLTVQKRLEALFPET